MACLDFWTGLWTGHLAGHVGLGDHVLLLMLPDIAMQAMLCLLIIKMLLECLLVYMVNHLIIRQSTARWIPCSNDKSNFNECKFTLLFRIRHGIGGYYLRFSRSFAIQFIID